MFRRSVALVGPLIALAVFTPAARAGLVSWTYKAVVQAGDGSFIPPASAVLSLGQFPSDVAEKAANQYYSAPLPTGDAGSMTGSGTIVLAASSKGVYTDSDTPPAGAVDSFRTLLQITDTASGMRGNTYINGKGQVVSGLGDAGEVQLSGEGRVLMTLGNSRYDITWHRQETESVSRIVADVSVTSLVNTPEPATLALAGLGLGAVAVRRLRRK